MSTDISDAGLALLKQFEELRTTAYIDTGGVWTIGWGHVEGVRKGDTCTEALATEWLRHDVRKAQNAITDLIKTPLTQAQFDALASMVFNIGVAAFRDSELRKRVNERAFYKAVGEMTRWYWDNGKPVRGLMLRRLAEATLFMSEPF